jgi:ParB family transcriptional regulator, chromosome partitioning protein
MAAELKSIPLDQIVPSPYQTRKDFDPEKLKELAQTMQEHGLMNPINVRPVHSSQHPAPKNGKIVSTGSLELGAGNYELIAGERRVRAAKLLGWKTIMASVEAVSDQEAAQRVVVENLQRDDLNPIEQAEGYRKLERIGLTQVEIAKKVGVAQPVVAQFLSLLDLEPEIREIISREIISVTQMRFLKRLPEGELRVRTAKQAAQEGWSVKETERQVNRILGQMPARRSVAPAEPSGPSKPEAADPMEQEGKKLEGKTKGWIWTADYPEELHWEFHLNLLMNSPKEVKKAIGQWFLAMATALGQTQPDTETEEQIEMINASNQMYADMVKDALKLSYRELDKAKKKRDSN